VITPKTALKYAKAIEEYCADSDYDCDTCPLYDVVRKDCKIAGEYPLYWKLREGDEK